MGFGHRVYRAEDPRARVLRRTAEELGAPRYEVADGPGEGRARGAARAPSRPGAGDQRRVLGSGRARLRRGAAAHVHADVHLRAHRRAGSAHILEQKAHRPADPAVGPLRRPGAAQAGATSRAGTARSTPAYGDWRRPADRPSSYRRPGSVAPHRDPAIDPPAPVIAWLFTAERHDHRHHHPRRLKPARRPVRLPAPEGPGRGRWRAAWPTRDVATSAPRTGSRR